jgi:hypothetical protein
MVRRARSKKSVSASALSQMGVCERLVVFQHQGGKRLTPVQKTALRRGLRAHRQFASEALWQGASTDECRAGRCFIATHVFGEGPETRLLRRFRDQFLRQGRAGRLLILAYYRLAPRVCRVMERSPIIGVAVRALMRPLPWLVERLPGMQEADHVD